MYDKQSGECESVEMDVPCYGREECLEEDEEDDVEDVFPFLLDNGKGKAEEGVDEGRETDDGRGEQYGRYERGDGESRCHLPYRGVQVAHHLVEDIEVDRSMDDVGVEEVVERCMQEVCVIERKHWPKQ